MTRRCKLYIYIYTHTHTHTHTHTVLKDSIYNLQRLKITRRCELYIFGLKRFNTQFTTPRCKLYIKSFKIEYIIYKALKLRGVVNYIFNLKRFSI